jgi:signal transduction histidine kinase
LLLAQTSSESTGRMFKKVQIDEIIWNVTNELKRFDRSIKISISIDESLTDASQMTVMGDEFQLKTAISNVIENACKYSEDHSVDITLENSSGWIVINFSDNGIGILPSDLNHVFEPFHRGTNAKTVPGHGIGLSLVKGILDNHSGIIRITSVPGKGTRVILKLPLSEDTPVDNSEQEA